MRCERSQGWRSSLLASSDLEGAVPLPRVGFGLFRARFCAACVSGGAGSRFNVGIEHPWSGGAEGQDKGLGAHAGVAIGNPSVFLAPPETPGVPKQWNSLMFIAKNRAHSKDTGFFAPARLARDVAFASRSASRRLRR